MAVGRYVERVEGIAILVAQEARHEIDRRNPQPLHLRQDRLRREVEWDSYFGDSYGVEPQHTIAVVSGDRLTTRILPGSADLKKFGFRIKTRGGMVVENLTVQACDRDAAETRIRQIYRSCEILICNELTPDNRGDGVDLESMISLISKEEDSR